MRPILAVEIALTNGPKYQRGTNILFLDKWLSEYIRYHRYWTNEYSNIFSMIKRSQINIQITLPQEKTMNNFANEYFHPKYLNIFKYLIICTRLFFFFDYFGHFHILCFFGPILNHFGPVISIFLFSLGNTENSNIFAIIDIGPMIIWIYLSVLINHKWISQYIRLWQINKYLDEWIYSSKYIWIYSNIRIFVPHWITPHRQFHPAPSTPQKWTIYLFISSRSNRSILPPALWHFGTTFFIF